MSVCTEIEVVGKSTQSWERAAAAAVKAACESFADRCLVRQKGEHPEEPSFTAEVIGLEMKVEKGRIERYIARVKVSFLDAESKPRLSIAPRFFFSSY